MIVGAGGGGGGRVVAQYNVGKFTKIGLFRATICLKPGKDFCKQGICKPSSPLRIYSGYTYVHADEKVFLHGFSER